MADNNPDPLLNLISSMESMLTTVADAFTTAISGVNGALGTLEARINSFGGGGGVGPGPGGGSGPGGGGPPNPPDNTQLIAAMNKLAQTITIANNQNAGVPPPVINGSTKPTYTAGQIAEMQRHQAQLASGRVNSDIPTFATEGRVLPQSPLSTLQRSNDLLGINLGVSNRAKPGDYPSHAGSIDIGNDLKNFLGKNETAIRTLQGSLGKSYEYSQNMGQTSDDFRNTMFTRSKMQEFYQQQEAAGTPISRREQGLFNVGLNERSMRDSGILTGAASNSLGRFISAHQSGATNYTPFIAMDSTGANGTGAAGATVSTRRVMKSDDMGTYAQGILKTMERMDQIGTASDVKQSAVNDVQTKLNSVRDRIAASVLTPDMERKLQTVGVDTSSVNFDAVRKAQETSTNASNRLKVLGEKKLAHQQELNRIGIEEGRGTQANPNANYEAQKTAIARLDKAMAKVEKIRDISNPIYEQGRSDIIGSLNSPEARRSMLRSGMPELAGLSEQVQGQNRLAQGVNVVADPGKMTTAERVQNKMTESAAGANEFAASMMKNLQWSLMFAFSGTVFQALSQIPTQATYETIQPVYSGISNIMGLTPIKNEFMQFGAKAPDIMGDLQTRTNSLQALLGSKSESDRAVTSALDISKSQPIQFGEAMEVMTAISTFPSTKSQASNPAFQKTMFENVQLMSMLAPEQGTSGALFAIREMLSGQYRSMQMRFNMSPEMLASYSGTTATQMKSMGGVDMMGAMNKSLMGMFGGSEILMRRGAETQVQMRNIGDTMTSSILNPMVSQTDPGIAILIDKLSTTVSDGKGGRIAAAPGSLGSLGNMLPEAQQKAIKDASLSAVASRANVRYELGDTVENIASKVTDKRGGSYENNLQQVKTAYGSALTANVQSLYSTPAGAQSVMAAGVNTALSNVLQSFSAVSGIAGITEGFLGKQSENTDKYTKALEMSGGAGNEDGRKKAAQDFIQGFMTDIRDSMKEASASLNTGDFKTVLKQVTDTVRIGAETVFAPIGEAIMIQTAKTAMNIPGVMVGGAVAGAIREVGSGVSSMAGGVVDVVTSPFKSDEQRTKDASGAGARDTVASIFSGGASVANMAAWTMGISGLKTSPLGAATKFMGAALVSKGLNDVAIGEGGEGASNIAMGLTTALLPAIIPTVMQAWTSKSIVDSIRGMGDTSGGASPSPTARTGLSGGASKIGAWLGAFSGIADVAGALNYNTNMVSGPYGMTSAPRSGMRTFATAMVGEHAGMGRSTLADMAPSAVTFGRSFIEGGGGLLGSGLSRTIMAGGGALAAYTGIKELTSGEEKSTTESVGDFLQAAGGVTMGLSAFGAGFAPAIAAIGGLASAAGAAASYIGKMNSNSESAQAERIAKEKQQVEDASINNPLQSARTLGGNIFDQLRSNANLDAYIPAKQLDQMRVHSENFKSFIPEKSGELAFSSVEAYREAVKDNKEKQKQYKEKPGAQTAEENQVLSSIASASSAFMTNAYKDENNTFQVKNGKATTKVRDTARNDLIQLISDRTKDIGVPTGFAEAEADKIIKKTVDSKAGYTSVLDQSKSDMTGLIPKLNQNALSEMWIGQYRPLPMPRNATDDASTVQQIPERTVENVQRANATFNQKFGGMAGIESDFTDDITIGGMSREEAEAIRTAKLETQYQLLVSGHASPDSLKGPEAAQSKAALSKLKGTEHINELFNTNRTRVENENVELSAQHVKMLSEGTIPPVDNDIQDFKTATLDSFITDMQGVGTASTTAAGGIEKLATALGSLMSYLEKIDAKSGTVTGVEKTPVVGATQSEEEKKEEAAKLRAKTDAQKLADKQNEEKEAAEEEKKHGTGGRLLDDYNEQKAIRDKASGNKPSKPIGETITETFSTLLEGLTKIPQDFREQRAKSNAAAKKQGEKNKPEPPEPTTPEPTTPEQNPVLTAAGDVLGFIFGPNNAMAKEPTAEELGKAVQQDKKPYIAPRDGDRNPLPEPYIAPRDGDTDRDQKQQTVNDLPGLYVAPRDGDTDRNQKQQTKTGEPILKDYLESIKPKDVVAPSQQELMQKFLRKDPRNTTVRDVSTMAAKALGGNMIVYGGDDSSRTVDANGVSSTPKPSEDKGMAYGASSSATSQRHKAQRPGGDMYWRNEETGQRGFTSIGPNKGDDMYSWITAASEKYRKGAAGGSGERTYMTPSGLAITLPSGTTSNVAKDQRPRVAVPEKMSTGALMQEANAHPGTVYTTHSGLEISVPKKGDDGFGGTYVNQVPKGNTLSSTQGDDSSKDDVRRSISLVPTAAKNKNNQQPPTIIINGPIHTPVANILAR